MTFSIEKGIGIVSYFIVGSLISLLNALWLFPHPFVEDGKDMVGWGENIDH